MVSLRQLFCLGVCQFPSRLVACTGEGVRVLAVCIIRSVSGPRLAIGPYSGLTGLHNGASAGACVTAFRRAIIAGNVSFRTPFTRVCFKVAHSATDGVEAYARRSVDVVNCFRAHDDRGQRFRVGDVRARFILLNAFKECGREKLRQPSFVGSVLRTATCLRSCFNVRIGVANGIASVRSRLNVPTRLEGTRGQGRDGRCGRGVSFRGSMVLIYWGCGGWNFVEWEGCFCLGCAGVRSAF